MTTEARADAQGITDDDLITAWGLLHEAMRATTPLLLRGIDPCGKDMSGPWLEVLIRLQRSPGHQLPMSKLAREVSLSSGGFTKLADRLEHRGYLARQDCPSDRRVTYAVLTEAGVALAEQSRVKHVALLREHVLGPLGLDGVHTLAAAARILRDESEEYARGTE